MSFGQPARTVGHNTHVVTKIVQSHTNYILEVINRTSCILEAMGTAPSDMKDTGRVRLPHGTPHFARKEPARDIPENICLEISLHAACLTSSRTTRPFVHPSFSLPYM